MIGLPYGNLSDSATLSGGSWPTLTLINLQQWDLATVARSATAGTTDTKLLMDHGSAKTVRAVCLFAHNLSSAATITIKRGTTSGGSDVYSGSAVNAWQITPTTYDGSAFGVFIILPTDTSARYTTIEIDDTTNAAGYVQIGRIFVGPMFVPSFNASYDGFQDSLREMSKQSFTEAGADWKHARTRLRQVQFSFPVLSQTEADTLWEIDRLQGVTEEWVYLHDISNAAMNQRYGFLALKRELSPLDYPYATRRSQSFAFIERGGAP